MKTIGIIPARLESTRLPRKMLLSETGKPLIQHTWEQVRRANSLDRVIVATDSTEIMCVVRGFGGDCVLTGKHSCGTDRVAEAAEALECDFIVNVQGNVPEIDPDHINTLVRVLKSGMPKHMVTLATTCQSRNDFLSDSKVKVACSIRGTALYFSRLPIPYGGETSSLIHIGIYGFRREVLSEVATLRGTSLLEKLENLEQLRALELGYEMQVHLVGHSAAGIDTREDYDTFVSRMKG